MKALLETSISWNSIKKRPKGDYMYFLRRAAFKKGTNTFLLDVCLNFLPLEEDSDRLSRILCFELPQVEEVEVQFDYAEKMPPEAEILRTFVEAAPQVSNGSKANGGYSYKGGASKKKEPPISGNLVLGKAINEQAMPISEIDSDIGTVVVEGQIFKKQTKGLKNGKWLINYLITDLTESASVKAIVTGKKCEEIDQFLKEGHRIKVRGKVEHDKFEEADVIRVKDIVKIEIEEKADNAPVKRVELHAHTKMSAMDGLADVEELLARASAFGHKAIAITDHGVVQAFPDAANYAQGKKLDIKVIYGLEGYLVDDMEEGPNAEFDFKSAKNYHIIILVKNQKGLENLYKLVSISHLEYFYRRPRILKSILMEHSEGLIIGSACEAGQLYQGLLDGLDEERLAEIIELYDYLEVQPLVNNNFLIENGRAGSLDELKNINRKIVDLGKKYNKPVVATCDVHYIKDRESLYRKIIMAGQGYKDAENGEGLYFRTTDEMLKEFSYLGDQTAKEIVIDNTNIIADSIERVAPVPAESFRPDIPDSDKKLREGCREKAEEVYGSPLPEIVSTRLERELDAIIGNGYAVLYISAEILVKKSLENGYIVGSRGSVGSSFAATMAGITEVNPLPPHYICVNPECKNSEFVVEGNFDCGIDLPDKTCPKCGNNYKRDGFNIPFETFMGFKGNKEPDIDLNFAGEYQSTAHKHVEEIFGEENVFRAGTIGKIAGKTAYGFVKKYFEEKGVRPSKWEIERLTIKCTGVRRTTGQHPGGIVILPRGHEIFEFCPIQKPANDVKSTIITTHYDYHSIDRNLLKLDILGHDVPSMLRMLKDYTGVDPLTVPLKDDKVDSIFNGTKTLEIKEEKYSLRHGTYGIPEFGTFFVRQMLDDIGPKFFSDLIRISGLSHGTDVWINNAQDIIREGEAIFQDVICTRDDIMNGLIAKGLPAETAFNIMEKVRKGKGVSDDEVKIMKENDVPPWYIDSCQKIGYMFPKAHAVAYVIMSYRIAYYKVYHPAAFYATFFSTKVADFNAEIILGGYNKISVRMREITEKGKFISQKEVDEMTVLEVALEMLARGYEFDGLDFEQSDASSFTIRNGKVLLPFRAIPGVGDTAAANLAYAVSNGPFLSVDDLRERAKLNKTALEGLRSMGVIMDLPETNQLTLF